MSSEKGFGRAMTGDRPSIHTDIKGWERTWTEDLDMQMHAYATLLHIPSLTSVPGHSVSDLSRLNNDSSILNIENQARFTCRLQERMARVVCRSIAEENFDAKWRGALPQRREECIYKALFNTFKDTDMDLRRTFCPETTLKFMAADGGEAYLRLLRVLMPAASGIRDPIRVPNTVLDRLASPTPEEAKLPGVKTYYRDFHISRSLVITTVVYDVFLAFFGLQEEHPTAKPSRNKHKIERMRCQHEREYMKRATDNYKQQRRTQPNVCWNCAQPAEKLLACSKCRPIGRKIAYCSRECQMDDWKNGTPQAHKLICGKAMTEDEIAALAPPTPRNATEDESWLPRPDRSIQPSPALLHQLAELRESKVYDYIVIDPTVSYNVGIRFRFDQEEKLLFVVHRNRAIQTGNIDSIRAMYTICAQHSHVFKLTPTGFRKQLELEYGVSIPVEPIYLYTIWPPPNAQEAHAANKSLDMQTMFIKQLPKEPTTEMRDPLGVD